MSNKVISVIFLLDQCSLLLIHKLCSIWKEHTWRIVPENCSLRGCNKLVQSQTLFQLVLFVSLCSLQLTEIRLVVQLALSIDILRLDILGLDNLSTRCYGVRLNS